MRSMCIHAPDARAAVSALAARRARLDRAVWLRVPSVIVAQTAVTAVVVHHAVTVGAAAKRRLAVVVCKKA